MIFEDALSESMDIVFHNEVILFRFEIFFICFCNIKLFLKKIIKYSHCMLPNKIFFITLVQPILEYG